METTDRVLSGARAHDHERLCSDRDVAFPVTIFWRVLRAQVCTRLRVFFVRVCVVYTHTKTRTQTRNYRVYFLRSGYRRVEDCDVEEKRGKPDRSAAALRKPFAPPRHSPRRTGQDGRGARASDRS